MGHSNSWKVALLIILIAIVAGVGKVEQCKKQPPVDESSLPDAEPAESAEDTPAPSHDPVSQFLTDLVGDTSQAGTDSPEGTALSFPLIAELPPLPKAFWPLPHLLTQAVSSNIEIATY